MLYEKEDIMKVFHIVPPFIQMVQPFQFDKLQIKDDIIWKIISSILIWVIWKARCHSRCFCNNYWILVVVHSYITWWLVNMKVLYGIMMLFWRSLRILKGYKMLIFREDGLYCRHHFGKSCVITLFLVFVATVVGGIWYLSW